MTEATPLSARWKAHAAVSRLAVVTEQERTRLGARTSAQVVELDALAALVYIGAARDTLTGVDHDADRGGAIDSARDDVLAP